MLDGLCQMLADHGRDTPEQIDASDLLATKPYASRFDGLDAAYEAAYVVGVSVSRAPLGCFRSDVENETLRLLVLDISSPNVG
jgi:hypothetical protein